VKIEVDNKYRFEFLPICSGFELEFVGYLNSMSIKF